MGVSTALSANPALAETCFSAFGGSVHYNFPIASTKFTTPGIYSTPGVIFGSLSSCAGLLKWPLIGTVVVTKTQAILAFRAMTVDASSCGAVDSIVNLSINPLSGPLQLHNDRTNFSNSTTFTVSTCTTPPVNDAAPFVPKSGRDAEGN